MNRTEAAYALVLEARKRAGELRGYWYEGVTLKLAHDCRLTVDFFVVLADSTAELHEVKGHMRGDADVKLRVAARLYPFPIRVVRRQGQGWSVTEVAA
jgi:hypothetical protein